MRPAAQRASVPPGWHRIHNRGPGGRPGVPGACSEGWIALCRGRTRTGFGGMEPLAVVHWVFLTVNVHDTSGPNVH